MRSTRWLTLLLLLLPAVGLLPTVPSPGYAAPACISPMITPPPART